MAPPLPPLKYVGCFVTFSNVQVSGLPYEDAIEGLNWGIAVFAEPVNLSVTLSVNQIVTPNV